MRQTAIRMPEHQFMGLHRIAKQEGRKMSSVLRHAVQLYIEAYQDQHPTEEPHK